MIKYTKESQFKAIYLIETFSDYFEVLKDISLNENNKILWYRGQFNSAWNLKPNLFRLSKETADYIGREIDPLKPKFHFSSGYRVAFPSFTEELSSFKELVKKEFATSILTPKNDFEWMFLGQHYGLLTPLVDFSTDPLIALFFSTEGDLPNHKYQNIKEYREQFSGEGYCDNCASVFVMLPGEVNKLSSFKINKKEKSTGIDEPVIIDNYKNGAFDGYTSWDDVCSEPLCIIAPKTDYRLIRQSGNFLCYGSNIQPIDYRSGFNNTLYKIFIPYCISQNLKDMLKILDLTHDSVYGINTYGYIADECREQSKDIFYKKIQEISTEIVRTIKKGF